MNAKNITLGYIQTVATIIAFTMLLAACTSVPIMSMWKLRNVDPFTADPAHIQVAVISDKILQLEDRSLTLGFGFKSAASEHNFTSTAYATVKAGATVPELRENLDSNEHITLFFLDDDSAHQVRLAQNRLRAIKQNEIDGDGSLAVNIKTGCFNGPQPEELVATIYIRFAPDQAFIKLNSGVDLLKISADEGMEFWQQC